MKHVRNFIFASASSLLLWAMPAHADLRLVMFEQAGCSYCALWHKQIGPIYPKTTAGTVAPLDAVNLHGNWKDDIDVKSRPRFTPTFVLVRDGVEIDRLEGYPGEDFFWGLVEKMLMKQPEWPEGATDQAQAEG